MEITYYFDGQGYHGVTDESPPKFKGVLFVGQGGETLDTVGERVYSLADLKRMQPVTDVPDAWLAAIGYEQPEPQINYIDRQVIDITWWPFAGSTPTPKPETQDERFWRSVGTLIVVGGYVVYLLLKI